LKTISWNSSSSKSFLSLVVNNFRDKKKKIVFCMTLNKAKFEFRNPKQIRIPNDKNPKLNRRYHLIQPIIIFFSFEHLKI